MAVIINSGWTLGNGWYAAGFNQYQLNAWGNNSFGQLGLSDTTNRSSPSQIGSSLLWSNIALGQAHSMAIQSPGTLWTWGINTFGQLGNNTLGSYLTSSPIQVSAPTVALSGSWRSTSINQNGIQQIGVQNNGTLWAWGNNSQGQLGTNTSTLSNISNPVQVGALSVWTQTVSGGRFSTAIQSNGTLWTWGLNTFGQLGQNNQTNYSSPVQVGALSNWASIACGFDCWVSLQSSGTLWTCGYNNVGQLGLSDTTNRSSPTQVGSLSIWTRVAAGNSHAVAIQSPGTLWAWGQNPFGALGLSDLTNRSSPIQVGTLTYWTQVACGAYFTLAIQSPGTLWGWGNNSYGQLGTNTSTLSNVVSPVQSGTISTWTQIVGGFYHSLAIQSNGTLWAMGNNSWGQLGLNTLTSYSSPVQVGALSTWTQTAIACGYRFSAAIQSNGTLFSWGNNSWGQLGLNTLTSYSSPVQTFYLTPGTWIAVNAGAFHSSVALISPGTLWAWGYNSLGQLGNNSASNMSSPVQIGSSSTWTQVSTGQGFATTAIQTPGTLWAWGSGALGQLGNNSTTNFSSPVQVGSLNYWTQTSCGYYSTAAILSPGTLWAWGNNSFGQLGLGDVTHRSSPVQVGALNTWTQVSSGASPFMAAIQSNGTLWAWGNNSFGQLGLNTTTLSNISSPVQVGALSTWTRVNAGSNFCSAIQTPGTLWAWGLNSFGQLGTNNQTNLSSPVQVGALTTWTNNVNGFNSAAGIRYG
jgi:alpha-tubulin suppressor-like RCC1 family protein